jgi:hypothetical protein
MVSIVDVDDATMEHDIDFESNQMVIEEPELASHPNKKQKTE